MTKNTLVVDARLVMFYTFHRNLPITQSIDIIAEHGSAPKIKYNKIIFAWDSPAGNVRRKQMYKEYKAHRKEQYKTEQDKKKLEIFNDKYQKMESIYNKLGNVIHIYGYEADDIANIISFRFANTDNNIWLLSSDKDWAVNLIADNIKQIHLTKGIITRKTAKRIYGIKPEHIIKVQALAGVAKENVKGIYRLGDKRVIPLFEQYEDDEVIDIVQDWVDNSKYGCKLNDYDCVNDMYQFNYELLRPITWEDLTEQEQQKFIEQFNKKEKYSAKDVEIEIFKTLHTPYLFQEKTKKFYRLT